VAFFYSQLLYDITTRDTTNPAVSVVESWPQLTGAKVGIDIKYAQRIDTLLVRPANHLKRQVKTLFDWSPTLKIFKKQ
jgi:hypothetical protein